MSFDNWNKRRRGEKVQTFLQPGPDDEGYYRKPITEMVIGRNGKPNGQRRVIDWIPVAYFLIEGKLVGTIGAAEALRNMSDDEVGSEELWSWVCRNWIEYEVYDAVANYAEPWPDMPKSTVLIPDEDGPLTDNTPRQKTREDYQSEIEAACASAPTAINSKEDAEAAGGIKNRIAELRLEADKVGKSVYQPLHAAYAKAQKAWSGMVTFAKGHEDQIDKLVRQWAERERQRLLKAEQEALAAKAEEEERNARAVDRAIGRGDPEPEPEVEEIVVPSTVVESIKPDYGKRAVKLEPTLFVTITNEAEVAAHFKGNAELLAVLQKLAERAVKLGHVVPGTTTREGYA